MTPFPPCWYSILGDLEYFTNLEIPELSCWGQHPLSETNRLGWIRSRETCPFDSIPWSHAMSQEKNNSGDCERRCFLTSWHSFRWETKLTSKKHRYLTRISRYIILYHIIPYIPKNTETHIELTICRYCPWLCLTFPPHSGELHWKTPL